MARMSLYDGDHPTDEMGQAVLGTYREVRELLLSHGHPMAVALVDGLAWTMVNGWYEDEGEGDDTPDRPDIQPTPAAAPTLWDRLRQTLPPHRRRDDAAQLLCGAIYTDPSRPDLPPQDPCGKSLGHEHGPVTDWKRDYHSNGHWSWRSTSAAHGVRRSALPIDEDFPERPPYGMGETR